MKGIYGGLNLSKDFPNSLVLCIIGKVEFAVGESERTEGRDEILLLFLHPLMSHDND